MARTFDRLGSDVGLTRYVGTESPLALDEADSWRGVDFALVPGRDIRGRPTADVHDLAAVRGRDNLGQALIVRLLTPLGGLAALGHPGFGSRLGELVGRLNDEQTRNLARLYTLQAVTEEPRVQSVEALLVSAVPGQPDRIRIELSVMPMDDDQALALGLEVGV